MQYVLAVDAHAFGEGTAGETDDIVSSPAPPGTENYLVNPGVSRETKWPCSHWWDN